MTSRKTIINDDRARSEWGLKIHYPLEEMVDDFVLEFEKYRNVNKEKNEEE
jgi:hypothetical protein